MSSPIAKHWIYTTILVENEQGEFGTGFVVLRLTGNNKGKDFLVTNKHVLHKEAKKRQSATRIFLYFTTKDKGGSLSRLRIEYHLEDASTKTKMWREHPDDNVDVLAINVTPLFISYPNIIHKTISYSLFADRSKLEELDITIADEILVIGYPSGPNYVYSNFPLVRQGIIATQIGEELKETYRRKDGTSRNRLLRGFLIDGAVIPGSSGSPVVLKPLAARFSKEGIALANPLKPFLLGIIAETRYAPIKTPKEVIQSFAGLGLAFDAETVKETIELFFQGTK